jgi:hypothetical protein
VHFLYRKYADNTRSELKKIPDVSYVDILGGRSRQVKVTVDKDKMAGNNLDFTSVANYIKGSNMQMQAGKLYANNEMFTVETGNFLHSADDVANLIVGMNNNQPVYMHQIATVEEGPENPSQYVSFGYGKIESGKSEQFPSDYEAVTLAASHTHIHCLVSSDRDTSASGYILPASIFSCFCFNLCY